MKILEKDIQKSILDWLRWHKIFCWKSGTGMFRANYVSKGGIFKNRMIVMGIKGVSDIIGLTPKGRLMAIEVKRRGNVPTKEQKWFLGQIKASGGISFVAYGIEDCERELKSYLEK